MQQKIHQYPICLLSTIYKLFTQIITTWMENKLDKNQLWKQAGFRSKYSTTDHKCREYNTPLCVGTKLQPQGREPGQRDTTKNHGRLCGLRQTPGSLQKQPCHLPEETRYATSACCRLWHMVQITGRWPNKHITNLRPHKPKWKGVCSTSHTMTEWPTSGPRRGHKS